MNATALKPHDCREENAGKFLNWIRTRGGLALWRTLDLARAGQFWTAPLKDGSGVVKPKPLYHTEDKPYQIVESTDDVLVQKDKEVRRFYVALRAGRGGTMLKLTVGGSRKVAAATAKAGVGAYHVFDYDTQEAIIMAPDGPAVTLTEWAAARGL